MQYLKEEIKAKIVASAVSEFKTKGYLGASMRDIAAKSGITVGNIYRYFNSKEALFDSIMSPVNRQLRELVYADKYLPTGSGYKPLDIESIMHSIMQVCEFHATEILILVYQSKGSKYENTRDDLIALVEKRIREDLFSPIEVKEESLAVVIATSVIEGIFTILKNNENDIAQVRILVQRLIVLIFEKIEERLI